MRMDKRELKWENVLAAINAQPEYLRGGAASALHAAATRLPLRLPSRVYLVGCGDSHYAGLATRFAFERWRGIPITEFEEHQLKAIRDDIDKDFAQRNAPAASNTATNAPTRLSSNERT